MSDEDRKQLKIAGIVTATLVVLLLVTTVLPKAISSDGRDNQSQSASALLPKSATKATETSAPDTERKDARKSKQDRSRPASRSNRGASAVPDLQIPFPCDEEWELTTYTGHHPAKKKVDFFSMNGSTTGKTVTASATGRVIKLLPDIGGVKINHGNGWYTLYLHMQNVPVDVGEKVGPDDKIGEVGSVGTSGDAHLHYEQLHSTDGRQAYTDPDIVVPTFDGKRYPLDPNGDVPVVTSNNGCK